MKELSKEKAKRYDEAIEKGKQIQNTPYIAHWDIMKEVVEHLFPELKESEDERIRNEIISAIEEDWPGHTDWIAWLEKQGEKIDAIENFDTEFEKQVSRLIASATNKEHEYNQGYVKWTANALLNYAKHELEKQGEQKPAWSEEDERIKQDIENLIHFALRDGSAVSPAADTTKEDAIRWIQSLKDRVQPQPKQEWSEEDEEIYNKTIKYIKQSYYSEKIVIDWLKTLKDRYL